MVSQGSPYHSRGCMWVTIPQKCLCPRMHPPCTTVPQGVPDSAWVIYKPQSLRHISAMTWVIHSPQRCPWPVVDLPEAAVPHRCLWSETGLSELAVLQGFSSEIKFRLPRVHYILVSNTALSCLPFCHIFPFCVGGSHPSRLLQPKPCL